jgi:DNA polymerase I-like protein with 3'-5' exonuclease and polymerase domains
MGLDRFMSMVWDQYDLKWSREFAQKVRDGYLSTYTGIRNFHNRRKGELKNGCGWFYVETQDGRRHMCSRDGGYSQSLNSPIQGSSADMGRKLLWATCRKLRMMLQVHDEFWALVPEAEAEDALALLKGLAESIGQTYMPDIPIRFDAQIADCWVH